MQAFPRPRHFPKRLKANSWSGFWPALFLRHEVGRVLRERQTVVFWAFWAWGLWCSFFQKASRFLKRIKIRNCDSHGFCRGRRRLLQTRRIGPDKQAPPRKAHIGYGLVLPCDDLGLERRGLHGGMGSRLSSLRVNFGTFFDELPGFFGHAFFEGLLFGDALLGRVFADIFGDFH
jgi:hypothetical protein